MKEGKIQVLDSPIAQVALTTLRHRESNSIQFRSAMEQLSRCLAFLSGSWRQASEIAVPTPLETTKGLHYDHPLCLVPVLRAGLGLVSSFELFYPEAVIGHVGLARDEATLEAKTYLDRLPLHLDEHEVMVLDPMLATGHSAGAALDLVKAKGASRILFISALAAPEGIEYLQKAHPDVDLITGVIDRELNDSGYILPGLGDAGDRLFGTL
ncbi:MAG: uracil phosphoribosyltransferase [Verrucomicrobiota bacterium]